MTAPYLKPPHDNIEILAAAGYCLERWTCVENHLEILYSTVSGMKKEPYAQIILASIVSFEVRLALCHAAMSLTKTTARQKEIWNWLYNRLTKGYKKRHEVAHFRLVYYHSLKRWELTPFYSFGRHYEVTEHGLTVRQIEERAAIFNHLGADLFWFAHDLRGHLRKRGGRRQPMPGRVRQHLEQVARTRAEQSRQPRPRSAKAGKKK